MNEATIRDHRAHERWTAGFGDNLLRLCCEPLACYDTTLRYSLLCIQIQAGSCSQHRIKLRKVDRQILLFKLFPRTSLIGRLRGVMYSRSQHYTTARSSPSIPLIDLAASLAALLVLCTRSTMLASKETRDSALDLICSRCGLALNVLVESSYCERPSSNI